MTLLEKPLSSGVRHGGIRIPNNRTGTLHWRIRRMITPTDGTESPIRPGPHIYIVNTLELVRRFRDSEPKGHTVHPYNYR